MIIAVKRRNADNTVDVDLTAATQVAFKNWVPLKDCTTEINSTDFVNITMPMYNFIEYSDNYSDNSERIWDFKRDEVVDNVDVTNDDNAASFKNICITKIFE